MIRAPAETRRAFCVSGDAMKTAGNRLGTKAPQRLKPPAKEWNPRYGTVRHKEWAKAIIRRAGGKCEDCGRSDARLFADHVHELSDGGSPFDLSNGRARCQSCHTAKTVKARRERMTETCK